MDQQSQGRRLSPKKGPSTGAKIAIDAAAVVLALLIGGYAALCAYASSGDRIYPNVSVLGVEIGGMDREAAKAALESALSDCLASGEITLSLSEETATLSTAGAAGFADLDAALAPLSPATDGSPVFLRGFRFLTHFFSPTDADAPLALTQEGAAQIGQAAEQLTRSVPTPVVETTWESDGERITFHKGETGQAVDAGALEADVLAALTRAAADLTADLPPLTVEAALQEAPPAQPDFSAIAEEVFVAPQDAYLDGEKKEIVPSVTGVSLDEEAAQALLSRTGEGENCTLSLTFTEPETTTAGLEEVLFRDLLGSAESRVTGTAARISNVNIGQGYIDGTILMPDEVFSYMALVAPYSAERGFKPASVYAGGGSRDELGGGLCQVSSTLYLATLRANLEIVERYQHAYVVSYLPAGMDATIYSNRLDFKFKNTTGYPMRVDFRMEKRSDGYYWLVAELYGTKTDDTYVVVTNKVLSTTPYQTVYQIDDTVPAGTRVKEEDPHTGQKVEVYRNVYSGDGTLISSTLESVNNFKKLDRLYRINSADAAKYWVDPVTGCVEGSVPAVAEPSPSPEVTPSPSPEVTPSPEPSPSPEATPGPEGSPSPQVTPSAAPAPSPSPEATPTAEPPAASAAPSPAPQETPPAASASPAGA